MSFILKQIYKNQKSIFKALIGNHNSTVGATHKSITASMSILYINKVFNDYLQYGNLNKSDIKNKIILELGPGDNFGVALKLLASGARKVYLLDKFYAERDFNQQKNIYLNLRKTLSEEEMDAFDKCIDFKDEKILLNKERIEYVFGIGIENSYRIFKDNYFDMIISRAVIQEINKTKKAFKVMCKILKKDGLMFHKIDLRDYGMFTKVKNHHLGNLMFHPFLYKLMTNHSGLPNRKRVSHYRKLLNDLNLDFNFFISHIFGEKEIFFNPHKNKLEFNIDYNDSHIRYIKNVRPKLYKGFRALSTEDLLISGIFMTAKK